MDESKQGTARIVRLLFTLAGTALFVGLAFYFLTFDRKSAVETPTCAAFGGAIYRPQDQKKAGMTLAKAGLTDYRWEEGRLMIPTERRGEFEKALGENQALPQAPSDIKREALTEMSQFEPESKTRLRELDAASRQLEATIEEFEQIESATVAVRTRTEQVGLSRKNITTASVGVTPKGIEPLSAELITAITLAVKHHFGIDDNANISIMDFRQGRSYCGNDRAVQQADFTSYTEEQARQERLWREKLKEAFAQIPGIQIAATVDLSPAHLSFPADSVQNRPFSDNKRGTERRESNVGNKTSLDVGDDVTFDAEITENAKNAENVKNAENAIEGATLAQRGTGLVFRPAGLSDAAQSPTLDGAGSLDGVGSLGLDSAPETPQASYARSDTSGPEYAAAFEPSPLRYRPRSIAVSIAVPESYVRKMIPSGEDRSTDGAAFQSKSEEIISYIRQRTETLLLPLHEVDLVYGDSGSGVSGSADSARSDSVHDGSVRVSLYADPEETAANAAPAHQAFPSEKLSEEQSEELSEAQAEQQSEETALSDWQRKIVTALSTDRSLQIRVGGTLLFALTVGGLLLFSIRKSRKRRRAGENWAESTESGRWEEEHPNGASPADRRPETVLHTPSLAAAVAPTKIPDADRELLPSEEDSRRLRENLMQSLQEELEQETDEAPAEEIPPTSEKRTASESDEPLDDPLNKDDDEETEILIDAAHRDRSGPTYAFTPNRRENRTFRENAASESREPQTPDDEASPLRFRLYDEAKGTTSDYRIEPNARNARTPHFAFTPPERPGTPSENHFRESRSAFSPNREAQESRSLLSGLCAFSPERIFHALRRESPQTAAAVLKYLPESMSRSILALWESAAVDEMRARIRRTGPIDPEVLQTIERALLAGEELRQPT